MFASKRLFAHSGLFDYIKSADSVGLRAFLAKLDKKGPNAIKLAVNARDESNFTPLMAVVAEANNKRLVKMMTPTAEDRRATKANRLSIIDTLIERGADLNSCDVWGRTAGHFAAMNNDQDACRRLTDAGASLDLLDEDGFAPADYSHSETLDDELRFPWSENREPLSKVVHQDKTRSRYHPPLQRNLRVATAGSAAGTDAAAADFTLGVAYGVDVDDLTPWKEEGKARENDCFSAPTTSSTLSMPSKTEALEQEAEMDHLAPSREAEKWVEELSGALAFDMSARIATPVAQAPPQAHTAQAGHVETRKQMGSIDKRMSAAFTIPTKKPTKKSLATVPQLINAADRSQRVFAKGSPLLLRRRRRRVKKISAVQRRGMEEAAHSDDDDDDDDDDATSK
jgi:hypothetical protein